MYKTLSRHLQHGEGKIREMSEQTLAYEKRKNDKFATIASARAGKIVQAKVVNILNYGAFVDVNGVGGFVHISEIARKRISDIHNELKVGTVYEFKILEVGLNKRGDLSLKLTKILDKPISRVEINKPESASFNSTPFSKLNHIITENTASKKSESVALKNPLIEVSHDCQSLTDDEYEDIKI